MSFPKNALYAYRKYQNMWGAFPKEAVKLLLKFPVCHYLLSILIFILVLILSV